MISKEKAKKAIFQRVQTYNQTKSKIKNISETDTRVKYIDPILESLGWDVFGKKIPDEVLREETVKGKESTKKRADYTLRINGVTRLVVEAKAIGEDLDKEEYITQATNYAYNKACNWAVLTDFENIILFFVDRNKRQSFYTLKLDEIDNFDQNFEILWRLSKESILNNSLENEAKRRGTQKDKIQINDQLYEDLKEWRRLLSNDIRKRYDGTYPDYVIDEIVQRIIDRLIFIRKAEDSCVEERKLDQITRRFDKNTYDEIKKLFVEYNGYYNSKLFGEETSDKHVCDKIEISDNVIQNVVIGMYHPKGSKIEYNFDAIDADILGNIYEKYLGFILQKGKLKTESKEHAHQKEQGIYYTPTYVVDFIVRNTLATLLIDTKIEPAKIKVLDPACGSGSFLIKAFDYLSNYDQKKHGKELQLTLKHVQDGIFKRKTKILEQNLFGVDLDPKAVEIAQLNLLLKLAEKRARLPTLRNNIRTGNSLIDDEDIAKDNAFKWDEKYPEIIQYDKEGHFKSGSGFDVIIGNPPWVFTRGEHFSDLEKKYFDNYLLKRGIIQSKKGKNIQSGKLNLYSLFILRSIDLMKDGSVFGFIIPNNILRTTTFDIVRKYILDNCKIMTIVDLGTGVFEGVTASSIVLIFKKENNKKIRDENEILIISEVSDLSTGVYKTHKIGQKYFYENTSYIFNILSNSASIRLTKKIEENTVRLGTLCTYIIEGIVGSIDRDVSDKKINSLYKPFLVGKDIKRYRIEYNGKWICYDKNRLHRARPEEVFLSKKILIQRISGGTTPLVAVYDEDKYYTFASLNNLVLKERINYDARYILALINSKLLNWYYSTNFSNRSDLTVNISKTFLEQLPIKVIMESKQQPIIKLVDQIMAQNKRLNEIDDNRTDMRTQIEENIQRIDAEINKLIYKIYRLNQKEIKTLESSLN